MRSTAKGAGAVGVRLKGAALLASAVAAVAVLAACGGGGHQGHGAAQQSAAAPSGKAAGSATGSGRAVAFNQQDISFAQNMIMHHRQAIDMAALVPDRTSTDAVRELAASVSASQSPEVDLMSRWLGSWGASVPEDMAQMDMSGSMPGMQPLADLKALAGLTGTAFDRKWLAMMKDHHEGAITMATQQVAQGSNPEAKSLAAQMIDEQGAEIDLIGNLLT